MDEEAAGRTAPAGIKLNGLINSSLCSFHSIWFPLLTEPAEMKEPRIGQRHVKYPQNKPWPEEKCSFRGIEALPSSMMLRPSQGESGLQSGLDRRSFKKGQSVCSLGGLSLLILALSITAPGGAHLSSGRVGRGARGGDSCLQNLLNCDSHLHAVSGNRDQSGSPLC